MVTGGLRIFVQILDTVDPVNRSLSVEENTMSKRTLVGG